MWMQRKAWLGHYKGGRPEWRRAYRLARMQLKTGDEVMEPHCSGVEWKAQLIVASRNSLDPLTISAQSRLLCKQLIDEVLAEEPGRRQ